MSYTKLHHIPRKFHPGSKEGDIDPSTGWEECQGHVERRASEMGESVTATFGKK